MGGGGRGTLKKYAGEGMSWYINERGLKNGHNIKNGVFGACTTRKRGVLGKGTTRETGVLRTDLVKREGLCN